MSYSNPLEPYKNNRVSIQCRTVEESLEINKYMVQLGGRDLHSHWDRYQEKTGYSMEDVSRGLNAYCYEDYYKKEGWTIIQASQILNPTINNNYEIF